MAHKARRGPKLGAVAARSAKSARQLSSLRAAGSAAAAEHEAAAPHPVPRPLPPSYTRSDALARVTDILDSGRLDPSHLVLALEGITPTVDYSKKFPPITPHAPVPYELHLSLQSQWISANNALKTDLQEKFAEEVDLVEQIGEMESRIHVLSQRTNKAELANRDLIKLAMRLRSALALPGASDPAADADLKSLDKLLPPASAAEPKDGTWSKCPCQTALEMLRTADGVSLPPALAPPTPGDASMDPDKRQLLQNGDSTWAYDLCRKVNSELSSTDWPSMIATAAVKGAQLAGSRPHEFAALRSDFFSAISHLLDVFQMPPPQAAGQPGDATTSIALPPPLPQCKSTGVQTDPCALHKALAGLRADLKGLQAEQGKAMRALRAAEQNAATLESLRRDVAALRAERSRAVEEAERAETALRDMREQYETREQHIDSVMKQRSAELKLAKAQAQDAEQRASRQRSVAERAIEFARDVVERTTEFLRDMEARLSQDGSISSSSPSPNDGDVELDISLCFPRSWIDALGTNPSFEELPEPNCLRAKCSRSLSPELMWRVYVTAARMVLNLASPPPKAAAAQEGPPHQDHNNHKQSVVPLAVE